MIGRADYEERKQARIDRLNAAAEKASKESNSRLTAAHNIIGNIPAGQPVMLNHYSAKRHIGDLNKADNHMRKAFEADEKAKYYSDRASAAETNTAISSDDPRAIEKLKAKVAELEAERDRVKAANKEARKNGTAQSDWFVLPYLARDIKAAKQRITELENLEVLPTRVIEFEGGNFQCDPDINRVIIRFDERQSDEVTQKLKKRGFKWSPTNKGWQRLRNLNGFLAACELCGVNYREVLRNQSN